MRWKVGLVGLSVVVMLAGCGNSFDGKVSNEVLDEPKELIENVQADENSMIPTPDITEVVSVMRTFDNFEEFEGKLLEIGLEGPFVIINQVPLAGDGEKEFVADVVAYVYGDDVLTLYVNDDKLLNDLPESVGKNVWSKEEFKAYLDERSKSSVITEFEYIDGEVNVTDIAPK